MKAETEQRIIDWLEVDRDRHSIVIAGDNFELWRVEARIGHNCAHAVTGYDLEELLVQALEGMVIPSLEGEPVE